MAQPMSMDRTKAAPFCGAGNGHAHRSTRKSPVWRFDRYEHRPALRAWWTAMLQVRRHRFSNIHGQWKPLCAVAFTVCDDDLAGAPIDVVKLEFGDFACPQAQTNKYDKNREFTTATSSGGIAGC
jgi:hypothetical protein